MDIIFYQARKQWKIKKPYSAQKTPKGAFEWDKALFYY
jgi:hypothetical protein